MEKIINENYEKNVKNVDDILHISVSFDLLKREFTFGERKSSIYYINGFCKDDILEKLQEFFSKLKPDDFPNTPEEFLEKNIPFVEVDLYDDKYNIITLILSGVPCMLIEGYNKAFLIDLREYPGRDVREPEKYKVLRGSRDGFVETLVFNTALIRRRIRNPEYFCEIVRVGKSSRTDIAICYMNDRVDKKILKEIKKKLENANVDNLSMNQESLSESIYKGSWLNPFPKFRYTERPDTVAASILGGQIAVLVDNSPAAMLLPTTIFDVIEEADDYYFPPITGTYLRLARMVITIASLILTPLFLLYATNPELLPQWLSFTRINDVMDIPIFWQLIILELAVDGLKLAAINTPSMLNTPLSLIAAIIIGEYAINTGWFNEQTMLYMAIVAIANFTHESYELAYAIKFLRIIILILTAIFGLYGFVGGVVFSAITVFCNKTISKTSYVYPLYPFNGKEFLKRFLRIAIKKN